jgi:hypothetical protein
LTAVSVRRRAARDGLLLAGVIFTAYWFWSILQMPYSQDSAIYWSAPLDDPYVGARIGGLGAYLYSPAFLQLMAPFRLLPWETFHLLWSLMLLGCLVWLVGRWTPVVIVLPPVANELMGGNINLLIAAAVVLGVRTGGAWAPVLLTKVVPGIGLLWFALRRQWREVAIGLGLTVAVAGVSFVLAPGPWFDWINVLVASAVHPDTAWIPLAALLPIPLWLRLPLAVAIVAVAARRSQPWLLPIGIYVALPALWVSGLVILLAIPRLRRTMPERQAALAAPAERATTAEAPSS